MLKKDLRKILSTILNVYFILFILTLVIKLLGFDYFNIDKNNEIINNLNDVFTKCHLTKVWCTFTLFLSSYVMISIVSNNKKKSLLTSIVTTTVDVVSILTIKYHMNPIEIMLFDLLLLFCGSLYANDFKLKSTLKRMSVCFILNVAFQAISLITKNNSNLPSQNDFVSYFILNFDYILLIIMMYKYHNMKGEDKLCGTVEVGSSLRKQTLLKRFQKEYQTKCSNKEKFEFILTGILYLMWNLFTVLFVVFIAKLNDTVIECMFILTSFWLSKKVFNNTFHLKNVCSCFVVSNLTYYCLNRITLPIGVSSLTSICVGVLLSYFTSKLVKKNQKKLYRGMTEEELKYWLDKVTNNKLDYKICKLYYVDRYSETKVAAMTCYSIENIKKRKRVINDMLKELFI